MAQDDVRGHAGNVDIGDRDKTVSVSPNDLGASGSRSGGAKVLAVIPGIVQKSIYLETFLHIYSFASHFQLSEEISDESNNLGERGGLGIDVNSSTTTSRGGLPVYQQGGQISNDKSYENNSDSAATDHTPQSGKGGEGDKPVPLGLLGGLQPKVICISILESIYFSMSLDFALF